MACCSAHTVRRVSNASRQGQSANPNLKHRHADLAGCQGSQLSLCFRSYLLQIPQLKIRSVVTLLHWQVWNLSCQRHLHQTKHAVKFVPVSSLIWQVSGIPSLITVTQVQSTATSIITITQIQPISALHMARRCNGCLLWGH